jgi:hypothetical protein
MKALLRLYNWQAMMLLTIIALLEAALQRDRDTKVVIATDSNAIRDSFTRHPQVSISQHTSAYVSMRQHTSQSATALRATLRD